MSLNDLFVYHTINHWKVFVLSPFRPHLCSECGVGFMKADHLRRHINSTHLKIKNIKCSFCDKMFSDKYKCKVKFINSLNISNSGIKSELKSTKEAITRYFSFRSMNVDTLERSLIFAPYVPRDSNEKKLWIITLWRIWMFQRYSKLHFVQILF